MALSIRNAEVEKMARRLAQAEGVSMTEVLLESLRLKQTELKKQETERSTRIQHLLKELQSLPDLNAQTVDEILGYGADGGFLT